MHRLLRFLRSIRFSTQLTILVTVAIVGIAVLSSMVSALDVGRRLRERVLESGVLAAENLARQSSLALLYRAPENSHEAVTTTLAFPDVQQVDIVEKSGALLVSRTTGGTPPQRFADAQAPEEARLSLEHSQYWVFEAPVRLSGDPQSPFSMVAEEPRLLGFVRVVIRRSAFEAVLASILRANLLSTLLVAAVAVLLANFAASRMTRPLASLSDLMRRAQGGESGMRAVPAGPGDIREMSAAFNRMMDVLEEREAQLMESRDAAVRVAAVKASFASTVSHEVRTPLNGVVGMLDMLRSMPMAPVQKTCVQEAYNAARSLNLLIDDVLDFSKLEAGKVSLEELPFDLHELLSGVIETLSFEARAKGLNMGVRIADDLPQHLLGDPVRLRQIFLNLVGNAVKFTERGEISIWAKRRPGHDNGDGIEFEVRDTGIGMSGQTLKALFEPFSQADVSTTRKYGGTGLGLSITRQLVQLMKGEIHINSELGRGTQCRVWLALPAADAVAEPEATRHERGGDPVTVLVVEDNRTNRAVAAGMLRMLGCGSVIACDGQEAVALASQRSFDLILMDCSMPGMDGYEATMRIRTAERGSGRHVPIVAMTANREPGHAEKCLAAGMDDFLPKPVTMAELGRRFDRWLPGALRQVEAADSRRGGLMDGPLDEELFANLRDVLGDAIGEAVEPFLEDMPGYLAQLRDAIERQDTGSALTAAHAIKGSSANIGAAQLSAMAARAHDFARRSLWNELRGLVSDLAAAFATVQAALRNELRDGRSAG